MIQDPDNRYIAALIANCDPTGRDVLEIGCGTGRITRDLARHARRVVATDPDACRLDAARRTIAADNVVFRHEPSGLPNLPAASFGLVVYTLSLHHVPADAMTASLSRAALLVRSGGDLAVLEPADGGSFMEAKARFGAGSGDEGPALAAAIAAIESLAGWSRTASVPFVTRFQFCTEADFFASMLPHHRQLPPPLRRQIVAFLASHRTAGGILLDANRRLDVLRREPTAPKR